LFNDARVSIFFPCCSMLIYYELYNDGYLMVQHTLKLIKIIEVNLNSV